MERVAGCRTRVDGGVAGFVGDVGIQEMPGMRRPVASIQNSIGIPGFVYQCDKYALRSCNYAADVVFFSDAADYVAGLVIETKSTKEVDQGRKTFGSIKI